MEFIAILLSSIFGLLSPAGLVVDRLVAEAIAQQLAGAETLEVRIDAVPTSQLLRGRIDRLRLAGRGVFPIEGVRIEALEVETDAIALDRQRLNEGRGALQQPLQAGIRLVLNRDDLNQALRSPDLTAQLQDLSLDLLQSDTLRRYDLVEPTLDFLPNQQVRLQATLQERGSDQKLQIFVQVGLDVATAAQLQIRDLVIRINDEPFPAEFSRRLASGISQRLDLHRLDAEGLTIRILQWQMTSEAITIAAFVRLTP